MEDPQKLKQDLPKYQASQAFVNLGINKKPETFVRGANQYSSGGDQGGRIVSSERIFDIQPITIPENIRTETTTQIDDPEQPSCLNGFGLYKKQIVDEESQSILGDEVWIGGGVINGQFPDGFDSVAGKLLANSGSGFVWAKIKINEDTGAIELYEINSGASIPSGENYEFYYGLGFYSYNGNFATVTNYGCGSLDVNVCRNWFVTSPPFYGVSISRGQFFTV